MKKIYIIAGAMALTASISAQAAVSVITDNAKNITLKVTEAYTLGDNDTMTSAKDINLESAKKSASDYAGTYVESELQVSGSKITKQQIRVLTAGFLEVLKRSDKRSIDKSGNVILNTTANIKLSKESIKDGLAKLKSDPERKAKIKSLEADNERLRNELISLTKKINSGQSRTDLMKAREIVLSDLNKNRQATKQVFEQGTLFQLATLGNDEYELAKKDIDENVFDEFKNNTVVKMGKPDFVKNANGSYNVLVPVDWNLPKSGPTAVLSKHFKLRKNARRCRDVPYTTCLSFYDNKGNDQKKPHTEKLLNYVIDKVIAIEIDAKYSKGYLPLSAQLGHVGMDTYALQFANSSKSNKMLGYSYRNPVVIKDLTEQQLNSITSLDAKVVVVSRDKLRRWNYE